MSDFVRVLEVRSSPILCLLVSQPAQAVLAAALPGQTILEEFHITLARPDDAGIAIDGSLILPKPPELVSLSPEIRIVATGLKRSCYVELTLSSRDIVRDYVRQCEVASGLSLIDPQRVFHVTLSNAGLGNARESVGAVWAFPCETLS